MITKLSVRNYKSLRDVQVDLERFTVLVGPNASGKSSLLQTLNHLCRVFRPGGGVQPFDGVPMQGFGGMMIDGGGSELPRAASRGSKGPIEMEAQVGGRLYRYRTDTSMSSAPITLAHIPKTTWDGTGLGTAVTSSSPVWKPWNPQQDRGSPLSMSILLRLEASKLIQATPAMPDPSVMAPDGTGLHSALAGMTLNDPDSWQSLQSNLRRIIPTIRRLRHTKASDMHQPTSLLFDTLGADSVPADQVSEGTLLVLGLLAALHAPNRPSLMLLDDLDRGLHPKAQKELIALLRGLMDTNPDLQIVATTHSPYMLDCVEVDEVRMTFLDDHGATGCAALTRHPEFPKWKDEMTPGEMWSMFGEKWVVEGATA